MVWTQQGFFSLVGEEGKAAGVVAAACAVVLHRPRGHQLLA